MSHHELLKNLFGIPERARTRKPNEKGKLAWAKKILLSFFLACRNHMGQKTAARPKLPIGPRCSLAATEISPMVSEGRRKNSQKKEKKNKNNFLYNL
jgi:hypothetical protein